MSREFSREAISAWVLRKLGSPTVNVELTKEQLEDCIDDALDEIAPWVVQRQYITLPTSERIDLSEHKVAYVINVHKTESHQSNSNKVDVFDPTSRYYACSVRDFTYANLENMLVSNVAQSTKDNISYRYIKPYLYLDIGYPTSSSVTIEYSPIIDDLNVITDDLYKKFVRRFAIAFARDILVNVRGKFTVSGSPVELDASTQDSKSSQELADLREELKNTVNTHFMVD